MPEDTPEFNEVSEECLKRALKIQNDLSLDVQILTTKINIAQSEIRVQLNMIDEYLIKINKRITE